MAYDRNLASINRKLLKGSEILEDSIRARLNTAESIAVLDIGCGLGLAMMELAWMFRDKNVRFAGINKDQGEPLASREDLRATASQIGLAPNLDLDTFALPELFFEDATHMHFDDESFDVVYASSVLRFVPHKAEFLEEIVRVLRPGGVALIRIGARNWDYPFGPSSATLALTSYAARWVLRHQSELIPLEAYLTFCSRNGIALELINRPSCVIRVTKQRRATLALGLRYDPSHSVPMRQLGYGDEDRGLSKGGVRSVYEVSEESYQAIIGGGLLTHQGGDPPATERSGSPQVDPERTRKRLLSYSVGQRVNIKGRRWGGSFCAAKIKMVHYRSAENHLEGLVEWVDTTTPELGILGTAVLADALASGDDGTTAIRSLRAGMAVRVRGSHRGGRFVAEGINVLPMTPILVEEIQGPIQAIDTVSGTLHVAGVTVETDSETKIDRIGAR